jgi:hypothetical protein
MIIQIGRVEVFLTAKLKEAEPKTESYSAFKRKFFYQ